jgi:hypothetical protein
MCPQLKTPYPQNEAVNNPSPGPLPPKDLEVKSLFSTRMAQAFNPAFKSY